MRERGSECVGERVPEKSSLRGTWVEGGLAHQFQRKRIISLMLNELRARIGEKEDEI